MKVETYYFVSDKKIIFHSSNPDEYHKRNDELCDQYEKEKKGWHDVYFEIDGQMYHKGYAYYREYKDEVSGRWTVPPRKISYDKWLELTGQEPLGAA